MSTHPALKSTDGGQLLLRELDTLSLTHPDVFRQRLEALKHKYQRSEQQLQQLVASRQLQLQRAMQLYEAVSGRIGDTRARVRQVRHNLINCKQLLHCRRDELKKLWLEGVEQKHMLALLEGAEQLRSLPEVVSGQLRRGRLYRAARQLAEGSAQLDGPLGQLQALQEVRAELEALSEQLHARFTDQLHGYLYGRSVRPVLAALSRQGSGRVVALGGGGSERSSGRSSARERAGGLLVELEGTTLLPEAPTEAQLEAMDAGGDEKTVPPLAVVLEGLMLLQRLPDTVESVRGRMKGELLAVVTRTTHLLADHQLRAPAASPLTQLVDALVDQFRAIAETHERVLTALRGASTARGLDTLLLYSMDDVWQCVQETLQLVVSEYLDSADAAPITPDTDPTDSSAADLSSFFQRKRPARPSAPTRQLFSFDASSTSLNMSAYLREKAGLEERPDAARLLADRPQLAGVQSNPLNITALHPPLMRLAAEIEQRPGQSAPCPLRAFINQYIGDVLLGQLRADGQLLAERRLDDWQAVTDAGQLERLGSARPLLRSAVGVHKFVNSLHALMTALPSHGNHLLSIVCSLLVQYKEAAGALLAAATRSPTADEPDGAAAVLSASWARDPDISRFLRELPNWLNQKQDSATAAAHAALDDLSVEESPEQVRQRNRRETEILAANLGDGEIAAGDLIGDQQLLRRLAMLHESLEWLGGGVQGVADALARAGAVPESSAQTLAQLGRDLEELGDTALLVLHLEVRLLCFHQLGVLVRRGQFAPALESSEPDAPVLQLNRQLTSVHALLQGALRKRKLRYVFEGVAPLAAHLLIAAAASIERVNENGVKRLARDVLSVQQALTSLTQQREPALDQARAYLELLLLDVDELLEQLAERGPVFSETEYAALLKLMHRSQPGAQNIRLHANLERLADIVSGDLAEQRPMSP